MSSESVPEHHARRSLDVVETGAEISQRSLARELGIALGLTNLLLKRLVQKGWIRAIHVKPNRVRYLITPKGIAEKTRMSRAYLARSVQFYRQTRDRIQERFLALSADWPTNDLDKRIVFYGAGEVAEIGYICLSETDLHLVGVIDECRSRSFFGYQVHPPERLSDGTLDGQPFDRLAVMSFGQIDAVKSILLVRQFPVHRVFWL